MKKGVKIIVFLILPLLVVGGVLFFILNQNKIAVINNNPSQNNSPFQASGTRNCGSDLNCFASASKTCAPANFTYTRTDSFELGNQTTTEYFEINGLQSGKCILYLEMKNIILDFVPGTPQSTIDEDRAFSSKVIGMNGTCQFETQALNAMLTRWAGGNFSSQDYGNANCSAGSYK